MRALDFTGLGGLLLLVLPFLAIACVLLSAPVALLIGRRQHEEERVARAPLLVAAIAVLLEALLALALLRQSGVREGFPLPVSRLYFELTPYAVGGVLALSFVTLVLFASAELSQAGPGVVTAGSAAAILFAFASQVVVALAGSLPTAVTGLGLCSVAVSLLLLIEAFKHARPARLWLAGWALAIPIGAFAFLWPYRALRVGSDMLDARMLLRLADPALVHSALARLWLAGALTTAAGLVAFAALPRVRLIAPVAPATCAGLGAVGVLPSLLRLTATAFPAGPPPLAHHWLSSRLAALAVGCGIMAAAVALAPLSHFRRLYLLSVGCLGGLAWVMAVFDRSCATVALLQALLVALALPICFGAVAALDATRTSPPVSPSWLPFTSAVALPIVAGILWGWPWAAARGAGTALAGLLLAGVLLTSAIRLAVQLARDRRAALHHGFFPLSTRLPQLKAVLFEGVFALSWCLMVLLLAALWLPTLAHLVPPLP